MPNSLRRISFVAVFLGLSGVLGGAGNDQKASHGTFTGEIKPVVYVRDVEASAPFYRDVLGFEFLGFAGPDSNPYYAEMSAAGTKFGLHEPTSAAAEPNVGHQRLYFRVKDLEAHRSRIIAWGGSPGEIIERSWMDMLFVRDLDSNEIVFAVTDPERHTSNPWTTR